MIKSIFNYLRSLRFTILLICLLSLMFMIGLWVPQVGLVKDMYLEWKRTSPNLVAFLDFFRLTTIYTSPVTVTLWSFFFLNLMLVIWQRIPVIKQRIELTEKKIIDPRRSAGFPFRRGYAFPEGLQPAEFLASLRSSGYTVLERGNAFYGIKNRYSPLAFGFFHLSFFLILLGGLFSFYTTFIGYLDLAQGENFNGDLRSYNAKPIPLLPKFGDIPRISFTIKSIVPQVVRNTPTGIRIELVDDKGRSHEIGINTPYDEGDTSFVFKHLGVAPLFVLKDATGKEIDGAYSKLDVMLGKQDSFSLGGIVFRARFYPDYALEKGVPVTRTQEFSNPTFILEAERGGKKIGEGTMPRNGTLNFDGYRLEMRDMPYWVRLYVIKEQGIAILYTGFAIACIAVIWRLLFYRREIIGIILKEGNCHSLEVGCRAEYYKSLAEEEFTALFEKLRLQPYNPDISGD